MTPCAMALLRCRERGIVGHSASRALQQRSLVDHGELAGVAGSGDTGGDDHILQAVHSAHRAARAVGGHALSSRFLGSCLLLLRLRVP